MNYITNEGRSYAGTDILCLPAFALLILLSLPSSAQDYYLETQTIASGEEIVRTASNTIYSAATTTFIVESGGLAVLKAGKRIELNPGFRVESQGNLIAAIELPGEAPDDQPPVLPGEGFADQPVVLQNESGIAVFPIPAETLVNINSPYPVRSVKIKDTNGLILFEQQNVSKSIFSVDISQFKKGFYILEIVYDNGIERLRITKN